ncbi:MAG: hypothetical protein EXR87_07260 [Gammaproteobacteria bacterium]|nr:hypothetical protein [Gammaproteobacteria bacterium]
MSRRAAPAECGAIRRRLIPALAARGARDVGRRTLRPRTAQRPQARVPWADSSDNPHAMPRREPSPAAPSGTSGVTRARARHAETQVHFLVRSRQFTDGTAEGASLSTTVILLAGPGPAAETRLRQLQRLADRNGLVRFRLVDARRPAAQVIADCAGAAVLIAPNSESSTPIAAGIGGLRLLQTFSAGTDQLDKALLLNHGIRVANNGGANAVCVAEHAIWLILTINHKFDRQIESVRAGRWAAGVTGPLSEFTTLVGKRVGIVGFGRIGSRVAKRLKGWECDVVYHDIATFDAAYEADAGARRVPLGELVATSDFVSLHVPLDRQTRKMAGADMFKAMKPTAVLINTCRGQVVDEAALIAALQRGEIWGAGLDVTEVEPTDPGNPLITMQNVVITPHQGARVIQSEWNAVLNAVENAERVARGLEPNWVVDPV